MEIKNELELMSYLKENWKKHFPKRQLVGFNVPIYGWYKKEKIGFVDIVFISYTRKYFVEVKLIPKNHSGEMWDALKVIGYAKAEEISNPRIKIYPVVMLHKDLLTIDRLTILSSLKVGYISFDIIKDGLEITEGIKQYCNR